MLSKIPRYKPPFHKLPGSHLDCWELFLYYYKRYKIFIVFVGARFPRPEIARPNKGLGDSALIKLGQLLYIMR